MKTETSQQLFDFIKEKGAASPAQMAIFLKISPQMVHRHLKELLRDGKIQKSGSPPRVLYRLLSPKENFHFPVVTAELENYLNEHYYTVSPSGETTTGIEGFRQWALRTKQHKQFTALCEEYVDTLSQLESRHRNAFGLIDARFKIEDTFKHCHLDLLYYQEFYSIPKFGKTRAGHQVYLGKSGQDIRAIEALAEHCRPSLIKLIKRHRIDSVSFTPHSIPRKISFLKEFQRLTALPLPIIQLTKSFAHKTPVAQKSLSKLSDRIENAENTLFVMGNLSGFNRTLLIDDAVGSGSTLNVGAEKLKKAGVKFVCGYAICGSLKGFEVINEV